MRDVLPMPGSTLLSWRKLSSRCALTAALYLGAASPAWAQGAPPPPSAAELAAARQLFGDGLRAEDEGRYKDALEAFHRVAKITVSAQVRYHVALCHEKLGELVEAINAYELAIQEGEARRNADVVEESRAHAAALRKKVAHLVIRVPEGASGVTITLDGRAVNAALAGTSMPVDPGDHRVVVRAEDREGTFELPLPIAPGEMRTVDVVLGAKKVAAAAPPPPPAATAPPPAATAPRPAPKRDLAPILVAGGATVAVTIGAVATGVAAHVDYAQYLRENVSPPTVPITERQALRRDGMTKAWVSTGLTLAALAGGGVTLWLALRPTRDAAPARALTWSPWAGPGGGGVAVRGSL
jgi:hypothetical protein